MRKLLTLALLCSSPTLFSQVNIIPQPVELIQPKIAGSFVITKSTPIVLDGSGLENSANFLNDYLQQVYGFTLKVTNKSTPGGIHLNYEKMEYPIPGAYVMQVKKGQVYIAGDNENGTFYGVQTLLQLLPVEKSASLKIPYVNIKDYPRFQYRGLMLDVGRHFFPISFVKKYIDYIALHKMNYFHWHLTEDQGWRIEIKKYPKLTEVGGWRNGTIIGRYPGTGNDNIRYGGFYTQEEVKEIVAYAAKRYVTVIPEIEMPGHASAALTAYPHLGCTGGPYKVQGTWGVFNEVFCAGNDTVFNFLQDVLDEVIPLFPAKYVHVGADECPKESWKKCPKCQQRIKDLGLKDEHELQSYFIQRMEKYINGKGKTLIGWDEILEGGLAPNAVVMSWRGEKGGIEAAKQKHQVIMTPTTYVYLDYSQTKNEDSVTIGGFIPLQKVYGYEPIPKELTEEEGKYVLGAQGNVWTEYMKYPSKVEYMVFPRATALSEVLWSPKEKRNWNDFEKRLQTQFKRYTLWGSSSSSAFFQPSASILPTPDNNGVIWQINNRAAEKGSLFEYASTKMIKVLPHDTLKKVTIYLPDFKKDPDGSKGMLRDSTVYRKTNELQYDNTNKVKVTSTSHWKAVPLYHHGEGVALEQKFTFNKATGKKVTIATPTAENRAGNGGTFSLVNGAKSAIGINSDEWLGWQGPDMEAVIDLGKAQPVSSVNLHILDQQPSWVYPPQYVEVLVSKDGKTFEAAGKASEVVKEASNMASITVPVAAKDARFVKVVAKSHGVIADGKPGSGSKAWLFVDEISVN
ncbi:family 20 glycosylhydrolase [Paraflavitalea sp. CAU 1676]|uniref:glycoside hydrolase family 20 protein n=1 Tax=Paraflavitalea sp. CAU 1676 TaxID=3032598 RepID=UPI0023DBA00F|nr:family 20 glycosylhydrolase [Paraflavitalea sp. CAU 1676]MDF2193388.1 family 20 glycosylhydrolase [Paraflavitalea sp. CAU 1676]